MLPRSEAISEPVPASIGEMHLPRFSALRFAAAGSAFLTLLTGALAQTVPTKPNRDSSGSQSATPAPLPAGQADVPGGTSRDGIVRPPVSSAVVMPTIKPEAGARTPIIAPPGTVRNRPDLLPK
jgi:hypothetical protein